MDNKEHVYKTECLKKYGKNSISFLTLSNSLSVIRGEWQGYIAFKKFFRNIIVLGDPIVPNESLQKSIKDLINIYITKKFHICLVPCTERVIKQFNKNGFKCIYIGKEAVVNLSKFNISGNKNWKIRSSINYAEKNKMIVEEYKYKSKRKKKIENEIIKISKEWCSMNNIPEPSFAIGKVDFENYDDPRYFICLHNTKIVGFINYYPIFGQNSYYLDLTRRIKNSPRGIMDYLLVKSFEILRSENINKIYIGLSPFSFLNQGYKYNSRFNYKLLILFKLFFKGLYPVESEFFFKKKYATDWEPNYICFYPRISVRALLALLHMSYSGGIIALISHKLNIKRNNQ